MNERTGTGNGTSGNTPDYDKPRENMTLRMVQCSHTSGSFLKVTCHASIIVRGRFLESVSNTQRFVTVQSRAYEGGNESLVFGLSSGVGFYLAIVTMAAIRFKLRYSDVPDGLKGLGITMILTGLLSMAYLAFSGIQL